MKNKMREEKTVYEYTYTMIFGVDNIKPTLHIYNNNQYNTHVGHIVYLKRYVFHQDVIVIYQYIP
jgi:hypothetical protein